ncbi:MAG: hypothetical protein QW328_07640 [Nitrososphaerota archaeon]
MKLIKKHEMVYTRFSVTTEKNWRVIFAMHSFCKDILSSISTTGG